MMFSDGIRPGGDLTELDNSDVKVPIRRHTRSSKKVERASPSSDSTFTEKAFFSQWGSSILNQRFGVGIINDVRKVVSLRSFPVVDYFCRDL